MISDNKDFAKKVVITVLVSSLILTILWIISFTFQVILLVFAGVMLAILLRGIASLVIKFIPVKETIAVAIVLILLLLLVGGVGVLMGPGIAEGFGNLGQQLPQSLEKLEQSVGETFPFTREYFNNMQEKIKDAVSNQAVISRVSGIFSNTLIGFGNFVVILAIGLYLAFSPFQYIEGIIKIIPVKHRERGREVLETIGVSLKWWLLGRFAGMTMIGILTTVGLTVLGVPLAGTLGIIAALFDFIPNIGPVAAAVPAILIALMQSPALALYTIILYAIIQTVDGYIITPLIEQQVVSLPPALIISSQILLGLLLGFFGVLLATPILVVVTILIQMLYIQDTLKDPVKVIKGKRNPFKRNS